MKTMKVNIVTPDGPVIESEADILIALTETGQVGILPGHIAMVAPLQIGALQVQKDNTTVNIAIHGGFIEVRPDVVTVLAQHAELASDIDLARAERAAKRAEQELQAKADKLDAQLVQLDLKRAINRINVHKMK